MANYYWTKTNAAFYENTSWDFVVGDQLAASPPQPSDQAFIGGTGGGIGTGTANAQQDVSTADGGSITVEQGSTLNVGGSLTVGSTGSGTVTIGLGGNTLSVTGPLIIGKSSGSTGILTVEQNSKSTTGDVTVGASGTGTLDIDGATFQSGALTIGQTGSGSSVSLQGGSLTVSSMTIGGQTATATGDPNNPWSYTGGTGTLTINGGTGFDTGDLTMKGGTIDVEAGGLEIGGQSGPAQNTLLIDANGQLTGHGSVTGTVTGDVPVSDTTTTPTYSLNIDNSGTIDAENGTLALDGNLSGDGQVLVGDSSTLEFGGSVADDVTVMFQPGGDGTIIIDDPNDFQGVISSENFEPGDSIDLPNVPYIDPGSNDLNPDGASFYFETGDDQQNYVLQVVENDQTYNIPINQDDEQWSGAFTLSDDGQGGTLITHTAAAATGYSVTASADGPVVTTYKGVVEIHSTFANGATRDGSGFILGNGFVLTAAHVVDIEPGGEHATSVRVSEGGVDVSGSSTYYFSDGVEVNPGYKPSTVGKDSNSDVPTDFAVLYVPGLPYDQSSTFGLPQKYIAGTKVITTGYPHDSNGNPSAQYSDTGNVTYNSGNALVFKTPGLGIGVGASGGPVWQNNGTSPSAIGIIVTTNGAVALTPAIVAKIKILEQSASVYEPFSVKLRPATQDLAPAAVPQGGPELDIVSAAVSQGGNADAGQTVKFLLNVSENVTVTGGGPTLTLNDGGTATYDATDSTGTQLYFDYTVGFADQTSNLEITQVNSTDTVVGSGNTTIDFTLLDNQPTDLSINSPLVVTSVASSQTGEVDAGQQVKLTLNMNGPVSINAAGGAPTLTLNDYETATYDAAASSPSAGTLVFDYTVAGGDEIANLEITSVNLPTDTTIQDAGGYNGDFSAAIGAPTSLQVGPAYVAAINLSQSSELTTGQTLQVTLAMSTAVTVNTAGGSPTLSLSDGATAIYDAAASNPSAGNLAFEDTVASSDYTSDLQVLSYNPNGAVVTDAYGVDPDFSGATQYDLALDVNAAIVTDVTVSPASGEADSGQTVTLTLTMSEAVTVNMTGGSPTLTLNDGATATYDSAASNPSAGTLVFVYTVGATDETPSLQVSEINLNGATINDGNGNAADLSAAANFTTNLQIGAAFVSSVTPSLGGEIFTGQTDELTLAMSQAVTVNTTNGSPTLSLSDGATATYDSAASDPASGTLVFDYTVGSSDYTTDLQVLGYNSNGATVTDANGVNADFSGAAQDLSLDINAAIVTNVTSSPSTGEADSGQQVAVTLTMNEAVTVDTGGGLPTLSLSDGATAAYDIGASNPSAGTLVFDYTVGAGDETPDLQVIQVNLNGGTIDDANGNAADLSAAANFDTGLQVGPVFVDSQTGVAKSGDAITLTLAVTGPVTVDTSNGSPTLTLNDNATATYDANASDPSDGFLVFDYTVGASDRTPDLEVTKVNLNGATIQDDAGVNADFSGALNASTGLTVNTPFAADSVEVVRNGDVQTGNFLTGQTIQLEIDMNEAGSSFTGEPTLTLNDGGTATYDAGASDPSAGAYDFDYTIGASDSTTSLAVIAVNLNGTTLQDANGNNADLSAAFGALEYPVSINEALVTSVSASATPEVQPGQSLTLTVTMNEAVTVDTTNGSPTLFLQPSAVGADDMATYDPAASDPSAGRLVFDYTVAAGVDNLSETGVSVADAYTTLDAQVVLNGATITNTAGDPANLALPVNDAFGFPTGTVVGGGNLFGVESVTSVEVDAGQTVTLKLTFQGLKAINTSGGSPTLTLNNGSIATYDAGVSNPSAGLLAFDYTAAPNVQTPYLMATQLNLNGAVATDIYGESSVPDLDGEVKFNSVVNNQVVPLQVGPDYFVSATGGSIDTSTPAAGYTGQQVLIDLHWSDAVVVNTAGGSPTLTLSDGATATYEPSSGFSDPALGELTFLYTVGASDETTDLAVDSLNQSGATLQDVSGVTINLATLATAQPLLGMAINAPAASHVTTSAPSAALVTGQAITLTLTTTEEVTVNTAGGLPTLTLNDGGIATYDVNASNPASGQLVFDYTVGATDETANLEITRVNPNGATIQDSSGNNAGFAAVTDVPFNYNASLEVNIPIVTSVAASQSGSVPVGQLIELTLTLNEGVTVNTVGGSPTLVLDDGATATYDAAISNPASGTLVFDYVPAVGDYTPDLTVIGLDLNGATIKGATGASAQLSGAAQDYLGLNISLGGQTIGSSVITAIAETPSTGNLTIGGSGTIALTTNENVTVTGTPSLSLNDGGTATYDAGKSTPTSLVFDYTVSSSDSSVASLTANLLNVPAGDSIVDGSGNSLNTSLSGLTQTGPEITISSPPPPILPVITAIAESPSTGDLTVSGTGTIALTTNENVTVTGAPTLTLNDGGTATYDAAESTGTDLVFDYSVMPSDSNVSSLAATALNVPAGVSIEDGSGNSLNTSLSGLTQTGPEISISSSPSAVPPTIAGTVGQQTTTSEAPIDPFSGVTVSDPNAGATDTLTITLSTTGATFGSLSGTGLGGSGSAYQLSGTAAAVTSELDALSYIAVDGVPGTSVTTTFTLSDQSSAFATATTNNTASVIDTDPAPAPPPVINFPQVANGNVDEWILANGQWAASAGPGSIPSGYQVAGTGDFTGNGTSDILWFNGSTGDTQEWLINNGGWAGTVDLGTHPGNYQIAGVGDFTGTGIDDVLWTSSSDGQVQTDIWELSSNGQWQASVSPGSHPAGYNVVGIGDFTGNGTSDILWQNPTTGDVDEWQIVNGSWAASVDLGSHPGTGWTIAGIGDFTGNGIDDVLWTNSSGGQVQTDIWELGPNGQWAASISPGTHPAGYNVVGIGDFTDNGISDILWQNAATGDVDEWDLSNGKWAASIDLGSHPGNFQLAGTGAFVNGNATSDVLWHSPS